VYEIGRVYIWQHLAGNMAHLNGTETRVMSGPYPCETRDGRRFEVWRTDSPAPPGKACYATPADLRPRVLPQGERRVMVLFR
jgi:hypothetical protein